MLPRFRAGDFAAGIKAGVAAMIRTLGGTYNPALPPVQVRDDRAPTGFPLLLALPVILIILFNVFSGQGGRRQRRGYAGPVILPGGFGGRNDGFGGGGFGGGSGGSGGGFSGGGGSFGGGGASGSW